MTDRLLAQILPQNATDYDRVLADQVNLILALDADEIRRLWNPYTCDLALLPYLAWAMRVDLWKTTWTEARKRQAVAQSFAMHRIKGTLKGIESYLGLVDATVVHATVPPATTFAMGGFDDDQSRVSWLDGLPQVRIYPYLIKRTAPKFRGFYARDTSIRSFFNGAGVSQNFMQASDGLNLLGRQAFYYKDGIQVPANYEVLRDLASDTVPERVSITTQKTNTSFYGSASYGRGYMLESEAEANVIAVRLQTADAQKFSVGPGSVITDVVPLRVNQTRTAPKSRSFLNSVARQNFMQTTYAPSMVYDQISILDPTTPLVDLRKKTKYYYGYSRFGIAPFTAELAVQIPMTRPRSRYGTFYSGFMQKADMSPIHDALTAIHVSRSLRDTILVDTEIYRVVQLSDHPTLGSFSLGELTKIK